MQAQSISPVRWWALAVLAAAQFMVIMDTSIIGVALPEIQRAVGFSQASLSWVFNAYVIAFGGLLLLGGRLSDLLGARRVFTLGFSILLIGSVAAGVADSSEMLLAGRGIQGLGSALIAPSALTLLMTLFSHSEREMTRALAFYGAAAPAGGTAGVFLGGVLTDWLSWPWVFLINVPIAVVILASVRGLLPASVSRRGSIDLPGAVSVTVALSLGVFAIVRAPEEGWGSLATILALALSAGLLIGFLAIQAARREPLMPLGIFRTPNLAPANVVMMLLGAAWIPMWFFLNLYLQQVLGYGAFEGGAALLPMTVTIMVLMVGATSRVVGRFGPKSTLVGGMLVLSAGILLLALVRSNGRFETDVLPATIVAAVGMSFAYIPTMMLALAAARPQEGGLASGIVNTSYQVGSALGLAVMTAVAAGFGADKVGDTQALTEGFQVAFIGAAIVAFLGAGIGAVYLRRRAVVPEAAEPVVEQQPA